MAVAPRMAQHLVAQLRKQRFIPDAVFRRRLVEQGFELVAAQMLEYRRLRLPGQPLRGQVQELATERTDVVGRQDRKSTRLNSSPLMRISYDVFCLKKKKNTNMKQ